MSHISPHRQSLNSPCILTLQGDLVEGTATFACQPLDPGTAYTFRARAGIKTKDQETEWGDFSIESKYTTSGQAPAAAVPTSSAGAAGARRKGKSKAEATAGAASQGGSAAAAAAAAERAAAEAARDAATRAAMDRVAAEYDAAHAAEKAIAAAKAAAAAKKAQAAAAAKVAKAAAAAAAPPPPPAPFVSTPSIPFFQAPSTPASSQTGGRDGAGPTGKTTSAQPTVSAPRVAPAPGPPRFQGPPPMSAARLAALPLAQRRAEEARLRVSDRVIQDRQDAGCQVQRGIILTSWLPGHPHASSVQQHTCTSAVIVSGALEIGWYD